MHYTHAFIGIGHENDILKLCILIPDYNDERLTLIFLNLRNLKARIRIVVDVKGVGWYFEWKLPRHSAKKWINECDSHQSECRIVQHVFS